MHSALFAGTMTSLGLDATYGSNVENLPGVTLAMVNLTSMFALQRRWRAALVGHLAISHLTSIGPMYRYGQALARFGTGSEGRRFYDVRVNVDAPRGHRAGPVGGCAHWRRAASARGPALWCRGGLDAQRALRAPPSRRVDFGSFLARTVGNEREGIRPLARWVNVVGASSAHSRTLTLRCSREGRLCWRADTALDEVAVPIV
jgi:hypothetical protein